MCVICVCVTLLIRPSQLAEEGVASRGVAGSQLGPGGGAMPGMVRSRLKRRCCWPGAKLVFPQNLTTPVLWPATSTLSPRRTSGPRHTELLAGGLSLCLSGDTSQSGGKERWNERGGSQTRPAGRSVALPAGGWPAGGAAGGDGVVLGFGRTRCLRGLGGKRCLGGGRGWALGPCRESSEDDEEESEWEKPEQEKGIEEKEFWGKDLWLKSTTRSKEHLCCAFEHCF